MPSGSISGDFRPLIERLFARLERKPRSARIIEVEAATLKWGYGDLVVNRLLVCGAWSCPEVAY